MIGVAIITCGRKELFKKCISSLNTCKNIDYLYTYEDTLRDRTDFNNTGGYSGSVMSKCELNWSGSASVGNIGVAKSKNNTLKYLLDKGCDHIFLIEDDIYIKDPSVFEKYIETSKKTGIQHFNFSQHGMMNKAWPEAKLPNPRIIIDYDGVKLPLYPHCVGAFSYYTRKCLETVGSMDERYFNACEHVDHTYEIIKAGMHPPYWYFADIENSWEYLGDDEWTIEKSTISSNPNHNQMMKDADKIFVEKHGHLPVQTPLVGLEAVGKSLKEIKNIYGK
jgi:GT2 family glycosyltransferase